MTGWRINTVRGSPLGHPHMIPGPRLFLLSITTTIPGGTNGDQELDAW
jgi:hypothetical protein